MSDLVANALRVIVFARLKQVETLINEVDEVSQASLAASEVPLLTAALRDVLALHEPDRRGRCRACSRWLRWRWQVRFPCRTWQAIHHRLVAEPGLG